MGGRVGGCGCCDRAPYGGHAAQVLTLPEVYDGAVASKSSFHTSPFVLNENPRHQNVRHTTQSRTAVRWHDTSTHANKII